MKNLLKKIPQFLFFTGKGGVGKTSMSCAISVALAQKNKKVLLISTDPASNLDEVLNTKLSSTPTSVNEVENLWAMNINPVIAATEYREKMVNPYRGILPKEAIEQMQEQLSGACTVEIAGFNEFSKYVGNEEIIANYDHIILDTAPTGHTLRLLSLPSAWNDFIADNSTGSSCLGPVSGLSEYKKLYDSVVENLKDNQLTLLILVSRAEKLSLIEASKASEELRHQGLNNQHLIINGVFKCTDNDPVAQAFSQKSKDALNDIPKKLNTLEQTQVGFYPNGVVGIKSLQMVIAEESAKEFDRASELLKKELIDSMQGVSNWNELIRSFEKDSHGLIMTMGKGGVGKTTIASMIASELVKRGHHVTLSTTDPAAHLDYMNQKNERLSIERIDPKVETKRHIDSVVAKNEKKLNSDDMQLLKEELSSPCIEEIAVFEAFAKTVHKAQKQFVVLDTAPTGHTLLLLDASNAYHKEVIKNANHEMSEELTQLLPRIKDATFTKILLVTLAEATPTHEAKELQEDLLRAGIRPYAWAVNRSFLRVETSNNLLCQKALNEVIYIKEIKETLSNKLVVSPWISQELNSSKSLERLI